MVKIHVTDGNGTTSDRVFEKDSILIGRSSRLDLTLPDRALSRQHARLFSSDGRWFVEDLGSRNGTFVNQARLESPKAIDPGDHVSLGSCSFRLGGEGSGSQTTSSSGASHTLYRSAAELVKQDLSGEPSDAGDEKAVLRLAERLRTLNEVHQALDQSITLDELLELILDRAFDHLRPQEAVIYLRSSEGTVYRAASRSVRGTTTTLVESHSLFKEVMEKGQAALVLDTEIDQRFNQAASLISAGIRSLVAAPLLDPGGAIGMILLSSTLAIRQFTEEDMELLASLASVASMRIRNTRLAAQAVERQRLEQEVSLARHIQVALLPKSIPQPEGYVIHGGNIPSRGVSGDFYKVIERAEGRECAVLLADVSGKGVAASLLTASLEALSAAPIEEGSAPDTVFSGVSRLLFARTPPEKYATAFLAFLDAISGTIRYVNAGHNPGLVVRANGETEWLSSTGPPLGLLPQSNFTAGEVQLQPGDTFFVYTDGITEAENPDEEEFGEQRLLETGVRHRNAALPDLAAAVEREVETFARGIPFADDRTLVMVRRVEGG
ncbi:MAG: SpoIIE family protein phosphatase [Acidobacteriota bacterium]